MLGQADFTSNGCDRNTGKPAANSLCAPTSLLVNLGHLYVSDTSNNRVLRYD